VPGTQLTAQLSLADVPTGTYQVRVAGVTPEGQVTGRFSDAVTVIVGDIAPQPESRPTITLPTGRSVLVPGSLSVFSWTVVPGVAQYFFEFSGPDRAFANPNGAVTDGVNGAGGAGGGFIISGTAFSPVIPRGIAAGTYQVRVIALTPAGTAVGTFSDAITVVLP
jgi:hypothetical protein